MDERWQFFIRNVLFCVEAFAVTLFCTGMIKKKKNYIQKMIAVVALLCILCGVTYLLAMRTSLSAAVVRAIITALIYAFLLGMVFLCLKGSAYSLLFFSNISYVVLFLSSHIGMLCSAIFCRLGVYAENSAWDYLVYYLAEIPVGAFMISLFRRLYSGNEGNYTFFFHGLLCGFFMAGTIGLIFFEKYIYASNFNYYIIFCFCEVFFGLVMLFLVYALMRQGESEFELSLMKQLWRKDRKHYELQKETIDIINIKCHDMRHQIRQLQGREHISQQAIEEMENSITIYESIVKTGNEVLDVLISDYFLRSQKNGIQFTYMSDGKLLNDLEEMDVYSLFGNILENAMEYEQTVADPADRFVSLSIRKGEKGVNIHAENFYVDEPPVIRDGIVETTKEDRNMHGFGMRSIRNIVGKYRGKLLVFIEDDMFQIDVFLPYDKNGLLVPESKEGGKEIL